MAETDITKYVANKIRKYREQKNVTQQELAEQLGTTQQSIARYENGERKADQNILFALSEYFGVSIDDFFPERKITNNTINGTQVLFDKSKDILSDDDRATIEFIMQKTINNYENSKKNE